MSIEINELIHTPTRLRIMATLMEVGCGNAITFTRLRNLLDMTGGNLSVHLRKLEEAKYIELEKFFSARGVPVTQILITESGKEAFLKYLEDLQKVLKPSLD